MKCSLQNIVLSSIHARLCTLLASSSSGHSSALSYTYFLPRQPRGPRENGCAASNMSRLFFPSHRSGLNLNGDSKFAVDKLVATGLVDTIVYICQSTTIHCKLETSIHLGREKMPVNCIFTLRNNSGKTKWYRGVDPHSFERHRVKIFQAERGSGVCITVRIEGCSNLFPQSSAYPWGFQKIVCYTAQDSSPSFYFQLCFIRYQH